MIDIQLLRNYTSITPAFNQEFFDAVEEIWDAMPILLNILESLIIIGQSIIDNYDRLESQTSINSSLKVYKKSLNDLRTVLEGKQISYGIIVSNNE